MSEVALSGKDVIQIDQRILQGFADGDCGLLSFDEDIVGVKPGKNGNVLYSQKAGGRLMGLQLRVIVGSSDDKFLNSRFAEQQNDLASFIMVAGTFSKRVGDGKGNQNTVVYQGSGGVFRKAVEGKTNADGDIDQSVAVYMLLFGDHNRSVQ